MAQDQNPLANLRLLPDQTPNFDKLQAQLRQEPYEELCAVFPYGDKPYATLWVNSQSSFVHLGSTANGGWDSITFYAGDPCA